MMIKVIESLLCAAGFINIFSGLMWTITEPTDHWVWFSRFSLGLICLGFYALLKKLENVEKIK